MIFSGIVIMLCLGTIYSWSVFRLPIEAWLGVGSTQSGLPYMTALAVYAVSMMLTGRVLDRFSPFSVVLVGSGFVAAGWILSAYVDNIFALTMTYGVLSGAGVGIIYGVPMSVVARWYPERKGL
ncbi:MAG TPA: MFS transporter, partial [Clostridiales bacterium UBA8960]|nr:MFS transporter [Clostridiales bacterium UBA8960]